MGRADHSTVSELLQRKTPSELRPGSEHIQETQIMLQVITSWRYHTIFDALCSLPLYSIKPALLTFSPSMAKLVTVIATCCHLSEGLKRLREVCEAMPTQQVWGNRSSSGTTTCPEEDSGTGRADTGKCCHSMENKLEVASYCRRRQSCSNYKFRVKMLDTIF